MMNIPEPAKQRLLHLMKLLEKNNGRPMTSAEAETLTGWSSYTIRKDISCLEDDGGAIGSSSGYAPETLVPAIRRALGLNRRRRFCVVGLGRLGSAYLNFSGETPGVPAFSGENTATLPGNPAGWEEFELTAGFDSNVNRVEILKSPIPLYPAYKIPDVVSRFAIELALLCVPAAAAQSAVEKLAAAGIRGILNFAPTALKTPPEVTVRNVHIVDELRSLAVNLF
jgi:redox-sensing transcriptional repressor